MARGRCRLRRLAEAARWRRSLQLCLASLWLLDGVLQVQVFMFGHGFARMVGAAARGNPAVIAARPALIGEHGPLATSAIAVVEIVLGLGIAWRPTVKLALAASIAWALSVWWLGEGLGGLLVAGASPVTGAPGAVILYAALAVLLWPAELARPGRAAGQLAGRVAAGGPAARLLWLAAWGGLSLLCLRLAIWSPGALRASILAAANGQPRWLASADATAGTVLAHHGASASFALAGLLAVIASGIFWPDRARRVILGIAMLLAVVLWAAGQNFGGLFSGMATDPNSGPLLLLLALAYWPLPATGVAAGQARAAGREAGPASLVGPLVRRDIDVMNVAMALAMVSLLAGRPSPLLDRVWMLTFAVAAAWFASHAIRGWRQRSVPGQHVTHLLSCGGTGWWAGLSSRRRWGSRPGLRRYSPPGLARRPSGLVLAGNAGPVRSARGLESPVRWRWGWPWRACSFRCSERAGHQLAPPVAVLPQRPARAGRPSPRPRSRRRGRSRSAGRGPAARRRPGWTSSPRST